MLWLSAWEKVQGSDWGKKTLTVKLGELRKWSSPEARWMINGGVEVPAIFVLVNFYSNDQQSFS